MGTLQKEFPFFIFFFEREGRRTNVEVKKYNIKKNDISMSEIREREREREREKISLKRKRVEGT